MNTLRVIACIAVVGSAWSGTNALAARLIPAHLDAGMVRKVLVQ